MKQELESLEQSETKEVVLISRNNDNFPRRWVYKMETDTKGQVKKNLYG